MKGAIAMKITPLFIAALLIFALVIPIVLRGIDPLQSQEYKAFELAHMVAADVNALSSLKGMEGSAAIERDQDFSIRVLFYDKKIFGVEHARRLYRAIIGDLNFAEEGYYVIITPFRGEREGDKQKAFIGNYPRQKDGSLEVFVERTSRICIQKEAGTTLARVISC